MKSKHDKDLKRMGDMFGRDPNDCIIIGFDTEDGPEHPLYDGPSNARLCTEEGVAYAYEHGITDPVFLVRDNDRVLVLTGRKKTKELREANKRRIANGLEPRVLRTIVVPGTYQSDGMRLRRITENWGLRYERTLMEKLAEAKELLEHSAASKDQIAALLQIKPSRLQAHLALLGLGARATAKLNSGQLTPTAAAPLCGKSIKDQDELLDKLDLSTPAGKRPTLARVREATGKPEIRTPKVRMKAASIRFVTLAPLLAVYLAEVPDDDPIWADLSVLAHELTDQTWADLTTGSSELDELPPPTDELPPAAEGAYVLGSV